MTEATARLNRLQSSPRKMRYVADMIRGMEAEKALFALQHSPKYGAKDMEKLLRSAIDNWESKNEGIRVEDAALYVKTIFVDSGRMLKRWLPAPHGRAFKKRKRSNHITLVIASKKDENTDSAASSEAQNVQPQVVKEEVNAPVKKTTRSRKSAKEKAVTA